MASIQILTRLTTTLLPLLLLVSGPANGQIGSLTLASGSIPSAASISLNLSLNASTGPAALQWMFSYTPNDVTSISVVAGPALTSAGKSLTCSVGDGSTV